MSRNASISIAWADGEHEFRLPIGQLRELQEKCDAGPAHILHRLQTNTWRLDDIRETLRLGLIGGGMTPPEALTLVSRYVDERPLLESKQPAIGVLLAALVGVEEEPVGNGEAAEEVEATNSREAKSPSPRFTEPEPSSDSLRKTWTG